MVSATRAGSQSMSAQLFLACGVLLLLTALVSAWEVDSELLQDGGDEGGAWRGSVAWYERHWRLAVLDPPLDPSSILWPVSRRLETAWVGSCEIRAAALMTASPFLDAHHFTYSLFQRLPRMSLTMHGPCRLCQAASVTSIEYITLVI